MQKGQVKQLFLLGMILCAAFEITSAPQVDAQSYDYVYSEVDSDTYIPSPSEARCRYTLTIKNVQAGALRSWTVTLHARPYSTYFIETFDDTGNLTYEHVKRDMSSIQIKINFRSPLNNGETYRFTYKYTAKWSHNSYSWTTGWSTSRIIEKIKLRISVSDQMRIVSTYPAGMWSTNRKTAEAEATNTKSYYLLANYPPTTGKWSILVLLVEFADLRHKVSREQISTRIFHEVNSYLKEASFGKISIAGDVTEWIALPGTVQSYNISAWGSLDQNRRRFEEDAIKAADNVVDYRNYDCVFIVTAGVYHQTVWAYSPTRMIPTNDNVAVERMTVQTEDTPWGTFAHEFGHQLGLPDLYDSAIAAKPGVYLEAAIYVGPYGLMSRSTQRPNMLGWCKLTLNWISNQNVELVNLEAEKTVKLHRLETLSEGRMIVKITVSAKQYYLVEVRERTGYDSVLPKGGVLVTYVDEMMEGVKGSIRLIDANPSTETLDDAPFDIGPGENSTFANVEKKVSVTLLEKGEGWYLVRVTRTLADQKRQTATEATTTSLTVTPSVSTATSLAAPTSEIAGTYVLLSLAVVVVVVTAAVAVSRRSRRAEVPV